MQEMKHAKSEIKLIEEKLKLAIDTRDKYPEDQSESANEDTSRWKYRSRQWTELLHRLYFFIASAYYNKGNYQNGEESSDDVKKYENEYYALAEKVRFQLLAEFETNYEKSLLGLTNTFNTNQTNFSKKVPKPFQFFGGLLTNHIFEEIKTLEEILNEQWNTITEWREEIMDILSTPLQNVNSDSEVQADGEEFERGVVLQDRAMAYQVIYD
jgi:E3 ubiquitin-protein ligase SHPRH